MKQNKCKHQFMFNIVLGTDCYHIIPHPSKEDEDMIIIYLKAIVEDLKNEK